MIIRELIIDGFGKFSNAEFIFDEKLNIISGKNEAGKSTLHAFIRAMLFGLDTRKKGTKPSEYENMRPWQNTGAYGGKMRVNLGDKNYLITRDFNKSAFDINVLCETTATKVEDTDRFIDELTKGLNQTAFENTVSIGQLGLATGKTMASELRKYMANMETTANPELNADEALSYLNNKRNELIKQIDAEAEKDYLRTVTQIKKLEEEIDSPQYENRINEITIKNTEISKIAEDISSQKLMLQDKLQFSENILLSKGLSADNESIKKAEDEAKLLYKDYKTFEKKVNGKGSLVFGIIFVLLFMGLLALAIINRSTPVFLTFGIAAIVCAVIAAVIFAIISGNRSSFAKIKEEMIILLKKYIDRNELTESNVERLFLAFENYHLVFGDIEKARAECAEAETKVSEIIKEQTSCINDLNKQHDIQLDLESKINEMNELKRKSVILKAVLKKNDEKRDELDAIDIAKDTLTELSEAVRSSIGSIINEEAGRMIQGVTAGKYVGLDAGRDFDIYLNEGNDIVPLYSLSAGTMDQTYLAIRLAAVRAMTDRNDELPLILDDSFALYDDERLRKAVMFISENYKGQIVIFTCHNREEAALIEKNTSFKKIVIKKQY